MPRFKVLAGLHEEGGKIYHEGEVVVSPHDLDEMFANKFRRLTGRTRHSQDHDDLPDEGGGTKVMDDPHEKAKELSMKGKTKKGGPGQDEEEFIDMSKESRMKGSKSGKKGKGGVVETKRKFAEGYQETVEEHPVDDEDEELTEEDEEEVSSEEEPEDEEESEDEEKTQETEGEEEETAPEEEETPKKVKKAGGKMKPKRRR